MPNPTAADATLVSQLMDGATSQNPHIPSWLRDACRAAADALDAARAREPGLEDIDRIRDMCVLLKREQSCCVPGLAYVPFDKVHNALAALLVVPTPAPESTPGANLQQQIDKVAAAIGTLTKEPESTAATGGEDKPIWERIAELAEALPDEAIAGLPTDGATQHDHYLYGSPKRQEPSPAPDSPPVATPAPAEDEATCAWPTCPTSDDVKWFCRGKEYKAWLLGNSQIAVSNHYGFTTAATENEYAWLTPWECWRRPPETRAMSEATKSTKPCGCEGTCAGAETLWSSYHCVGLPLPASAESPDGGRFLWARRKRGSGSLDILYQVGEHLWSLRWHGPARLEVFDVLGSVAPPAWMGNDQLEGPHAAVEGT